MGVDLLKEPGRGPARHCSIKSKFVLLVRQAVLN
jgi:hypothetical protein